MIGVELAGATAGPELGGKGATLARLAAGGFPVPPGLVLVAGAADSDLAGFAANVVERLGAGSMAVRSSGLAEDGKQLSLAGRFLTLLDVEPAKLEEAVRVVRRSGPDGQMAVLVMPMLASRASGIAFTVDPVTGEAECRITAVAGVSAELTAGRSDGEEWVVGVSPRRITDHGVLAESEAASIASLARSVEGTEGRPQDIEWAIEDSRLLLLQARPVTGLRR